MLINIKKKFKHWLFTRCPYFAGRYPYFGTGVYFPPDSQLIARTCQEGIFEQINLQVALNLLQENETYLDVGANIGLMSVPILRQRPSVSVLSFEPSTSTWPYLKQTWKNCSYKNRWHINNSAVGAAAGEVAFFTSFSGNDAFGGLRDTRRGGEMQKVKVAMTTIDQTLVQIKLAPVGVIKIDVEGAELDVLRGAAECLKRDRPFILLEWNYSNIKTYKISPEELLILAQSLNYEVFSIPKLLHADSNASLKLFMTFTESFLLVPNDADLSEVKLFEFMR